LRLTPIVISVALSIAGPCSSQAQTSKDQPFEGAFGGYHVTVTSAGGVSTVAIRDHFRVWQAVASPSGRFLAMTPPEFRWRDDSSVYFVYDLARSPSANRMPNGRASSKESEYYAGIALYPPENARGKTYRAAWYLNRSDADPADGDSTTPFHFRASRLEWISDHTLAFVDYAEGVTRLVVADATTPGGNVREQTIDAKAIASPAATAGSVNPEFVVLYTQHPAAYLFAESIERRRDATGREVLRLHWQSSDSFWTVPFSDFPLP
jgi:hypothetical protein